MKSFKCGYSITDTQKHWAQPAGPPGVLRVQKQNPGLTSRDRWRTVLRTVVRRPNERERTAWSTYGEWTGARIRRRSVDAAHVVPARRAWPDRHEIRLRRRAVRRLHRPSQRRGGPLLRRRRCRMSAGKSVVTIEGLAPQGRASGAGRLARSQRAAMRLLPDRPDHAGGGAAGEEAGADRQARSPAPWPATSAAAAAISASMRPFAPPPRGRDMTYHRTHSKISPSPMSAAAACSRASPPPAGSFSPHSSRPCARAMAYADRRRQDAEWRRDQSAHLRFDRQRRHRHHRRARAEMGTGAARTTLPMIVADELDADWARVRVVQSPGDEKTYGNQDTDGSRSVRHFIQPMRQCGAAARRCSRRPRPSAGASTSARSRRSCTRSCTRRRAGSSATANSRPMRRRCRRPPPTRCKLKEPSAFRYIGKGNVAIVDLFDITTGKAIYGQDVMLPGMKFAVVARPPVVGGKVASFDDSATMKVPGVDKVVKIDGTPRAGEVRSARRRRRHRQEHLGGAQGPRRAQDHLGRRAEQRRTTPRPTRRMLEEPCASPARSSATRATRTRRWRRPPR